MPYSRRIFMTASAAAAAAATLAACSSPDNSSQTSSSAPAAGPATIEANTGSVTVKLPVTKAACLDNRAFEMLANWGVPLVAAPKGLIPATVTAYSGDGIVDIGNHREPNLEALAAAEPDLIITGQRFSRFNEQISSLTQGTPVIDLEPRKEQPFDTELFRHAAGLGKLFAKEAEADKLVADFKAAVERAKKAYDGNATVMAVNVSGGKIGFIAPKVGRTFGPLYDLLGLTPALQVEGASDDHQGDDVSVEAIAQANPAWMLVLDRDGAVAASEPGYTPAKDVIAGNAALQNVAAITSGHVVYAPQDTYTNESIITYTEIITSIAEAFEKAKG